MTISRSPELMSRQDTAVLVVDVQERLIPLIPGYRRLIWNIRRLLDGALALGLPRLATEQYPRGLGHTVAELASRLPTPIAEKSRFSCRECSELFSGLAEQGIDKILVAGIEAHVCVQQTVHDLLAQGFRIYVAVDAIGSRFALDKEIALRRLESIGATLTTTEAALFEWCEFSGTPEFKTISNLVKEAAPEA
jgi:nicotinamidase-related amidase